MAEQESNPGFRNDEDRVTPTVRATLVVIGDELVHDDCSRVFGLTPTGTMTRGEKNRFGRDYPESSWSYRVADRDDWDIASRVEEILDAIWPRLPGILDFLQAHSLEVHVAVWIEASYEDMPIIELSPELLRLATLRASWGCDFG